MGAHEQTHLQYGRTAYTLDAQAAMAQKAQKRAEQRLAGEEVESSVASEVWEPTPQASPKRVRRRRGVFNMGARH